MINLLLNILPYENDDKKYDMFYLTCVMMCTIIL